MQERGVFLDHSTAHRWAIKVLPVMAGIFSRRKRHFGESWSMTEPFVQESSRGLIRSWPLTPMLKARAAQDCPQLFGGLQAN